MTSNNPEIGEMKSKPSFSIDIVRGNETLGFTCSFNSEPGASGANDNYSKYNYNRFDETDVFSVNN